MDQIMLLHKADISKSDMGHSRKCLPELEAYTWPYCILITLNVNVHLLIPYCWSENFIYCNALVKLDRNKP